MAKPRKSKNDEQRQEGSGVFVRHQKLCISVDMQRQRIHGYTELEILVPENEVVGLHADNMTIHSVSVDGEPVEFHFLPHYELEKDEKRWTSVSCPGTAADAAGSAYISSLEREMTPNLLILSSKSLQPAGDQPPKTNNEANGHAGQEHVKSVRIDYWVEKPETGIHFGNNVLHTNNQIRRARCWFPCIDSPFQRCCYDLEFTVHSNLVAVSNGTLLYQVLTKDDPPRKTYVYKLSVPVAAGWISLAVAPFEILPDRHSSVLSHMCLSPDLPKLRNTVGFFYGAFSHYEDYLSSSFPLGSYKQVFIAPEMVISPMSFGASTCIFSSQLLFDEKVIDQTIDTRIKFAYALAKQWFGVFITAETPNDEWLLDGLAGFLTDSFIKRSLGNNEARYRRYKANCAVCAADTSGATALSSSTASADLHGTQNLGFYGKIRSWKSVAILQMLEKQMGPESFCKILQIIIARAQNKDKTRSLRTLSTKEFRHFSNKIGNLERPFLKEFFPRWVGSSGCPVLRMGFSYNKRRNMIELAVLRGCTASAEPAISVPKASSNAESEEGDVGWPGMMSIRVHELDGMYDHPSLPMAGEICQLLEIQCHTKLAAKRIQKPKKGSKPDGSDDNGDGAPLMETRSSVESPLLWIKVDPEMEYLAEVNFHQPVQMWINQLEKDKDVVAQAQAIAALEILSPHSFSVINALNNFLIDSKAFWRVRIDAAYALANTASEETDWTGLQNLLSFYKSRRYDATIGLPRPNDFHDFPEYFVLQAIPHAVAMVRATDHKSPQEAVEFVLQLLKYNDNHGNLYSDVYWLAALVQSIGELEFGQQGVMLLPSILKRIDRLLQFDRVMPSYNGTLTVSCIRTLTQIAIKLSPSVSLGDISGLIRPFLNFEKASWLVRIEASRALLDLEFYCKGMDAALLLFMELLNEEPTIRGQVKLAVHVMHLCQIKGVSETDNALEGPIFVGLLRLLESRKAFNNIFLRHHLFCIIQILARRPPTLYGVPRAQVSSSLEIDASCSHLIKAATLKLRIPNRTPDPSLLDTLPSAIEVPNESQEIHDGVKENADTVSNGNERRNADLISNGEWRNANTVPNGNEKKNTDTVSNGNERRLSVVKIRVKQSATSSRAEEVENNIAETSHAGPYETEMGPCSSASVDAPVRVANEPTSTSYQNIEEVHSSHGFGSLVKDEELTKELQCTADSMKVGYPEVHLSPATIMPDEVEKGQKYPCVGSSRPDGDGAPSCMDQNIEIKENKVKEKKKKEKKRKREDKRDEKGCKDDLEYLERKRQKKEKKKAKEKEEERDKDKVNLQIGEEARVSSLLELSHTGKLKSKGKEQAAAIKKMAGQTEPKVVKAGLEHRAGAVEGNSTQSTQSKLRIKFKSRTVSNV
ncbi:transcription initiation factor TFIID subunit 2 [Aristolochia californica]|uniref:transcription initiation factor TFIID subunit 2 n=1 Tax=Aristolochia californica TaxID=171875 RepID=UPI0035E0D06A